MPLRFEPEAFDGIPPRDQQRLLEKASWIWEHRNEILHHPLAHNVTNLYKRRVGPYRIVYSYDSGNDDLVVHLAGLRDEIYDVAARRLTD